MRSLAAFAISCTLSLTAQTAAPTPDHPNDHGGMQHMDKPPAPPSKSLTITVQGRTTTLTLDVLLQLPQTTVRVHNAHTNQDETYTGPPLAIILARAGLPSTKETDPLILHSAILATGTDHYFVLYSAAEVEPAFSRSQVIVAVMKSGLPDTAGGLIQLITPTPPNPPAGSTASPT